MADSIDSLSPSIVYDATLGRSPFGVRFIISSSSSFSSSSSGSSSSSCSSSGPSYLLFFSFFLSRPVRLIVGSSIVGCVLKLATKKSNPSIILKKRKIIIFFKEQKIQRKISIFEYSSDDYRFVPKRTSLNRFFLKNRLILDEFLYWKLFKSRFTGFFCLVLFLV